MLTGLWDRGEAQVYTTISELKILRKSLLTPRSAAAIFPRPRTGNASRRCLHSAIRFGYLMAGYPLREASSKRQEAYA